MTCSMPKPSNHWNVSERLSKITSLKWTCSLPFLRNAQKLSPHFLPQNDLLDVTPLNFLGSCHPRKSHHFERCSTLEAQWFHHPLRSSPPLRGKTSTVFTLSLPPRKTTDFALLFKKLECQTGLQLQSKCLDAMFVNAKKDGLIIFHQVSTHLLGHQRKTLFSLPNRVRLVQNGSKSPDSSTTERTQCARTDSMFFAAARGRGTQKCCATWHLCSFRECGNFHRRLFTKCVKCQRQL